MNDLEPLILTDTEIVQITGRKRRAYQAAWLVQNGFKYLTRTDGSLVVSRRHFEFVMGEKLDRWFLGVPEPDFDALN